MGTRHHPWARKGKEQRPRRRERGHNNGHQGPHAGRACQNGGTSTAPPPADTARPLEAHAPNTRRRNTNRTPYGPHRLTPTSHQTPHKGRRAHLHEEKELHPQRKPPRTPPRSPPPRPHRQATTPATARATSQAREEEKGAATAPNARGARGQDPQRTRDHSTGPKGGQPRRHLTDPPARAARPDPHSTDPPSHPSPNRTPRPPASHPPTRTPHHDTGRTDLHQPTTPQHGAARHTTLRRTTVQRNTTRHPKAKHATARRDATRHRAAHHSTTQRNTTQPSRAHRNTARTSTTQHGKTRHDAARRTTAHHNTKARDANGGSNQNKPPHTPGRRRRSPPHAGKGPLRALQQRWRSAHTNRRHKVKTGTAEAKGHG